MELGMEWSPIPWWTGWTSGKFKKDFGRPEFYTWKPAGGDTFGKITPGGDDDGDDGDDSK